MTFDVRRIRGRGMGEGSPCDFTRGMSSSSADCFSISAGVVTSSCDVDVVRAVSLLACRTYILACNRFVVFLGVQNLNNGGRMSTSSYLFV